MVGQVEEKVYTADGQVIKHTKDDIEVPYITGKDKDFKPDTIIYNNEEELLGLGFKLISTVA